MRLSARGKCVWLDIEKIKQDAPSFLYLFKQKPTSDDLLLLKQHLVEVLQKKGFVFFDKVLYRYKINRQGFLKEYSINYWHLK